MSKAYADCPQDIRDLAAHIVANYAFDDAVLEGAITAALDTERSKTQWQDISTAPKDGRRALVYRPLARNSQDEPIAMKRLIGGNHHCWECTVPEGAEPMNPTDGACHVTHWMPLPPAPEAKP
jgi:hypothetical protein